MIWIFLICLILLIILLEKKLSELSLKNLITNNSISAKIAEPNENITLITKVYNKGVFPIMYVRLTEKLPLAANIVKSNNRGYKLVSNKADSHVQFITYLTPHMRRTFKLTFSLPNRGRYTLGDFNIAAGDFLGLSDSSVDGKSPVNIVIKPRKSENSDAINILGGFIGDISVRRFILEDPVSTIGFREYTGREPFKSISWLQTARTGNLHVKQYDHTVDMTVSVILNTENGSNSRLEACYSLARTVCEKLEAKHIPYSFYLNADVSGPIGTLSYIPQGLGTQHLNTILYGLGCAGHKCIQSFESILNQCIQDQNQNQGYIIITPPMSTAQMAVLKDFKGRVTNEVCVLIGEYEEN